MRHKTATVKNKSKSGQLNPAQLPLALSFHNAGQLDQARSHRERFGLADFYLFTGKVSSFLRKVNVGLFDEAIQEYNGKC